MHVNDLETPSVLINLDRMENNIRRMQDRCNELGIAFRPHIKTHKLPRIAEMQLDAGAIGITCQKVSEAEAMVAGSDRLNDVLITYNILGDDKLHALVALARKVKLAVVADNATVIDGLSAAFAAAGTTLSVFVECNTGADRCGVGSPHEAAELAGRIHAAPGLHFAGLMTYPPVGGAAKVQAFMTEAKALIETKGIAVPAITSGGSPDMMLAHLAPVATEFRPGTYVYNDRSMVRAGECTRADLAMHILATVVSRPAEDRAVLDAGSKTLTSDLLGFSDYGEIDGFEDARIVSLSEEHAVVDLSACAERPEVGDRVHVIPNHACVVTNLFDEIHLMRGDHVEEIARVTSRGRLT